MSTRKKIATKPAPRKRAGTHSPRIGPKIGDEAVRAKTGRSWANWFGILDRAGARRMSHKEIVRLLAVEKGLGPWWQQMVAVTYEQARGLRAKHEKPAGFEISRSKTIAAPVGAIFEAWGNARRRAAWLAGEKPAVRKATENRSLRITWTDGTNVEVMLYPKGAAKTQVSVQHGRLASAKAGERQKAYWGTALNRLAQLVES
jgi:hypothetical protein